MKKDIITRVFDYYFNPAFEYVFGKEIERSLVEFFGGLPIGEIDPASQGHFEEWFLFDFKIKDNKSPLRLFYEGNPLKLSSEELSIYKDMQENYFDFFEVIEIEAAKSATLRSTRLNKSFSVLEKTATKDLKKGDWVILRVFKNEDHYEITGGSAISFPGMKTKQAKKFTSGVRTELNPKVVYGLLKGMENPRIQELEGGGALLSGGSGPFPQEEYDNCAVCQLLKRCKEEGRNPTEKEMRRAMKVAGTLS